MTTTYEEDELAFVVADGEREELERNLEDSAANSKQATKSPQTHCREATRRYLGRRAGFDLEEGLRTVEGLYTRDERRSISGDE